MNCVDIKKEFGDKYKVRVTPGYKKDPWNFEVICKFGVIYPNGDDELGFIPYEEIKEAPVKITIGTLNKATEGVMLSGYLLSRSESSDPKNLLFRMKDFKKIAKIVKPCRKVTRVLTEEHKQAAVKALKKYREAQQ